MKKSHFTAISWAFLLVISLSAYMYLINVPTEEYQEYYTAETTFDLEEAETEETKILLPDVALVKKIIDMTRVILHGH